MRTVVLEQPGVFRLMETAEPVLAPGEALVRVHRVGICGTDLHAFAGRQPFFEYPRVLGHELGVEVIDPGSDPHGLRRGDRCSVEPYLNCGRCSACRRGKSNCCAHLKVLGVHVDGGMRPLLAVPAAKLHRSARLDYDQLALIETLAIGAHAVERADVQQDDFVLVAGAGPIGLSAIQFALTRTRRLAVMDVNAARLDTCRALFGVQQTLHAGGDPAAELMRLGGDLPTVVIDATGNPGSMAAAFDLVASGGRIVFVGLCNGNISFSDPNFHRREITLLASRNAPPATFQRIIALAESGQVCTAPWITHRIPFEDTARMFQTAIVRDVQVLKAMIEV